MWRDCVYAKTVMRNLMKYNNQIFLLSIIIFITITLLTKIEQAEIDGFDQYGYPFQFYTFSYCKDLECYKLTGFHLLGFLVDFFIAIILSIGMMKLKDTFNS